MDLKVALTNICERWKYKLDETSPGVFRLTATVESGPVFFDRSSKQAAEGEQAAAGGRVT